MHQNELILWIDTATELPDEEITVLAYSLKDEEVVPAYLDAGIWHHAYSNEIISVSSWAEWPEGQKPPKI